MIQSLFGKSNFEDDGTQNYLILQRTYTYFNTVSNNDSSILSLKSKWLSDKSIKPPFTSNEMFNPPLNYVGTKARVEFKGDYLKQDKISFDHGKVVNIYIVFEINKNVNLNRYSALGNCLFGAVNLTKHIDIDQYEYFGHSIEYYRKGFFSIGDKVGRSVITFGVNMSSSPHQV